MNLDAVVSRFKSQRRDEGRSALACWRRRNYPFKHPPPLADSETSGLQIILMVPEVLRTLNRYEQKKRLLGFTLRAIPFSRAHGTLKLCATVKLSGSSHFQLQEQPQIPIYLKSLGHGADVQQTSLTAPIHFKVIPNCARAARNVQQNRFSGIILGWKYSA